MSHVVYRLPHNAGNGRWSYLVEGTEVVDLAGTPESYRVKGACMNCKWEGHVRFPLGTLITRAGKNIECPACACPMVQCGSLVCRETVETDSSKAWTRAVEDERTRTEYMKRKGLNL